MREKNENARDGEERWNVAIAILHRLTNALLLVHLFSKVNFQKSEDTKIQVSKLLNLQEKVQVTSVHKNFKTLCLFVTSN